MSLFQKIGKQFQYKKHCCQLFPPSQNILPPITATNKDLVFNKPKSVKSVPNSLKYRFFGLIHGDLAPLIKN